MAARRNVGYSRLPPEEQDDDDSGKGGDLRFSYAPSSFDRIPWKSIGLAMFLLSLGSVLLFLSFFIFTGHMGGDRSQAIGFLVLGILAFLPGFYETRIAYYSWREAPEDTGLLPFLITRFLGTVRCILKNCRELIARNGRLINSMVKWFTKAPNRFKGDASQPRVKQRRSKDDGI